MLLLNARGGPRPRCLCIHAVLPAFINHEQPPTKKRPFSTILSQRLVHTLDVVLPKDAALKLQIELVRQSTGTLRYAKVHMKLSEIIDGDFFHQYIKAGNIIMVSEGRHGIDHVFTLSEGILHLEVDKPTFERLGLEGKVMSSEGRKHVNARYSIDINLRLPSMVRGKKGFERVIWAFKNVLNHTVTWLFCDATAPTDVDGPIAGHQPLLRVQEPRVAELAQVEVPQFPLGISEDDSITATEVLEWLTLASILCPRLQAGDKMDPYLSRYQTPTWVADVEGAPTSTTQDLLRLRWHGLVTPKFTQAVFLAVLKATADSWAAMITASLTGSFSTILVTNNQSFTWEYRD